LREFADAIGEFPIPESPRPAIAGGFYRGDGTNGLQQEHLALEVYPIGKTGDLAVRVRLATEDWDHEGPEFQDRVELRITTGYEPMARFSRDLRALVEGRASQAELGGSPS
jgi:hypothetical protein